MTSWASIEQAGANGAAQLAALILAAAIGSAQQQAAEQDGPDR